MKVAKSMTWQTIINIFTIVGVLVALYTGIYLPMVEEKPDLEFHTTPHYVGNNTAVNAYLIRNKGTAAATNICIYFELNSLYTIKNITSNLEYNTIEGGVGMGKVKIRWDRLEPGNSLKVSIYVEADLFDIYSIIPESLRVWSDTGILEEQGM